MTLLDAYTVTKVPDLARKQTKWVRLTRTMAAWFTTPDWFAAPQCSDCFYCAAKQ